MYAWAPNIAGPAEEMDAGPAFDVIPRPDFIPENPRAEWGKLIELTAQQKARLKKWLKKSISQWKQDTADLAQRLLEDNELVEGIVPETDWPWPGASNVHMPITEMYMEVYKSIQKRSILGADTLWYPETDEAGEVQDVLTDIGDGLNYLARNEWNVHDALSKVIWTTNRDGLGIIQATWDEETEPTRDIVICRNAEDFSEEFESPEAAGLTPEQFELALAYIAQNASEDFPVEIPIKFDRLKFQGVRCEIVELVNFVRFPTDIEHIKDRQCRGYGKRYWMRSENLREKSRKEVFYKDAVTSLLAKKSKGSAIKPGRESLRWIDGITDSNEDSLELYELVTRGRLDGTEGLTGGENDEPEGKHLVTYSDEHDELLQCTDYFYRVDFYALFKIGERPGRIQGPSVPSKTRDINDEVDTQHNQRINSRTIAMVPSFKAQSGIKDSFDPNAQENRFRPGVVFWLQDFDSFAQFTVQPTDLGESMNEEKNDMSVLDLLLGSPVALFSGGAPTGDPSAPGNKTAMLISQGNLRMDDPLDEFRKGVEELGDICLSHEYQFGENVIRYLKDVEEGGEIVQEMRAIHKRYLRRGIKMKMKGVTVAQNPDAEMMKMFNLHALLMGSAQMYATNPTAQLEVLREALRRGRVPNRHKILPSLEQLKAQQVEVQKEAMGQMLMERALAAKAQQVQAVKERLAGAKQTIQVGKTAETLAQAGIGQ
jgi:hypothetical protein